MFNFEMPKTKAKRLAAEAKAVKDKEALQQQNEIGQTLASALEAAAGKNKISNIFADGKKSDMGAISITRWPNNGGGFSIFPVMEDKTAFCCMPLGGRGHTIYQIDINLSKVGSELHYFKCPYGPEDFSWDISRLEEFTKFLEDKVERFTMFPRI